MNNNTLYIKLSPVDDSVLPGRTSCRESYHLRNDGPAKVCSRKQLILGSLGKRNNGDYF